MVDTYKKCDMHVHSSSCFSRDYDQNDFIQCLSESDLDVIAITDHNSVDVPLLEKLHASLEPLNKTVFPGVELNVKLSDKTVERYDLKLGEGREGAYFHGIVWVSYDDRERLCKAVDALFCEEGCITSEDIENVCKGSLSRKALSKKTDGHSVFLEKVQEVLEDIPHFFVLHENKGDRNLSDYLPNSDEKNRPIKSNLDYKDKLFYYSPAMAVEGGDKSQERISTNMKDELNLTLAALLFSDAQELDQVGKDFTWIDFDGDLESLLLAISDPESRIVTSDKCQDNPQTNKNNFLESVRFETVDSLGKAHAQIINLSPGLNGIIGSRGSGKSMFAHITSHQGLNPYSELVSPNTIEYKISSSSRFTKTTPNHLYLKQGELEELYNSGNYSAIPFFKEKLEFIVDKAEEALKQASESIRELIDKEKDLIKAYLAIYPAGIITMDVLNEEPPSGLVVDFPNCRLSSDNAVISGLSEKLTEASSLTIDLKKAVGNLPIETSHPENELMFSSINERVASIQNGVNLIEKEIESFIEQLNKVEENWFFSRSALEKSFAETKKSFNQRQDASHLNTYNLEKDQLLRFLEDLLTLRLKLSRIDSLITQKQSTMHAPIEPVVENVNNDEITIEIAYSGFVDFDSAISALTSGSFVTQELVFASSCLIASEPTEVRKLFNGKRIRAIDSAETYQYLEKFLNVLLDDLISNTTIDKTVSLNGDKLDEMSPGMRAEALLKLFLNDKIVEQDTLFVILDQPEDNLDTETISKFLIPRIKSLKTQIQFIVISHSAPIVINGDARSLVLCKSEDKLISYSVGAINNKEMKEEISEVLDGGERFLKMRLNKYNFQIGD